MTTPHINNASQMPEGVLKVDQLGDNLQGLNPDKIKATTESRMASNFLGTPGGLAGGPIRFINGLFANFLGGIADDAVDSPTVSSPDDVRGLTNPLFGELVRESGHIPIIGDLIEGITGIEDGDVNDIGTFFIQLRTLLSGGTVTSPLPNLIGLALPTIQSMVNQISDIFNGFIVTPINSAIQGVKDWFADLVGWKLGIVSGALGEASPSAADQAAYEATKALYDQNQSTALASANAAAAVQQISQTLNGTSGGLNKLLRFPYGTAISTTDWSYTSGVFEASSSSQLALAGSTSVGGYYSIRSNYHYVTDDQAVAVQLGANLNNSAATYLVLRADSASDTGVVCAVTGSVIAIGTISAGTYSTTTSVNRTSSTGDSVEFRAVGDVFVVLVNGTAVLSYNAALGSKGASYRSAFIVKQKAQPFVVAYSVDLASVGLYDYGSAGASITTRTAARVSRLATTDVSLTVNGGASALFPSNFFAIADFTQNMTVDDLGLGRIKATVADWYEISCSFTGYSSSDGNIYYGAKWCLYVNGAQVTHGIPAGGSIKWPLAAGDIVQPGVFVDAWYPNVTSSSSSSISNVNLQNNAIKGGPGVFFQVVADT